MKKNHILRKAAALLLAGAMLTGTASAEGEISSETNMTGGEAGALRHVMENIRDYLYMFDYDMTGISVSDVYPVYTFGEADTDINFYTCYAIKDGKIIGDFAISESGGKYNSTFGLRENPEIDEMLANNLPVSFAADGNNLYMVGGETACVVSSEINQEGTVYSASELNLPELEQRAMRASEVPQVYSVQDASDIITRNSYKVPKVKSTTTYNTNGQCWAACVASKVMYEVDEYKNTNLTADIVYEITMDSDGDIPNGRKRYYKAMKYYSIMPYEHSKDILLSADSLISKADNTNITIFRLTCSAEDKNHAMLFAGCLLTKTSGGVFKSCKYYIMDPNHIESYRVVNINKNIYDGKEGFAYTFNSGSVYVWDDSIYNQ